MPLQVPWQMFWKCLEMANPQLALHRGDPDHELVSPAGRSNRRQLFERFIRMASGLETRCRSYPSPALQDGNPDQELAIPAPTSNACWQCLPLFVLGFLFGACP